MGSPKLSKGVRVGLLVGGAAGASSAPALNIVPTFSNTSNTQGAIWTAQEMATVNAAINDWVSKITDNQTVNVTFDFTDVGTDGYIAQWNVMGGAGLFVGENLFPWSPGLVHTIHLNADDLSSDFFGTVADAVPGSEFDALSVFRHEIGHMMGFSNGVYLSSLGDSSTDKWSNHITINSAAHTAFFDAAGLNVQLASDTNLSHAFDVSVGQQVGNITYTNGGGPAGDLMSPAIANGVRRDISSNDLQMLQLAYGYTLAAVPEPVGLGLLLIAGVGLVGRRRKATVH